MKTLAVSAMVLFAASVMSAQTAPAKSTDTTDPKVAPATPAPAKPGAKKDDKKKDEKKKEEEPKIPGITINRPNGTFLGLEVVSGNFKLTFYDKKKKAMPIDVTRATARWPNKRSATTGDFRTVLNPGGPSFLVGSKPVVPPLVFNVYLTLLQGEGDGAQAVENYVVPFQG